MKPNPSIRRAAVSIAVGLFAISTINTFAVGTNIFSPDVIAPLLWKVNEYQFAHPVSTGPNRDRNWRCGTYYTGVMSAYRATRDSRYLQQARDWAERNQWRPGSEAPGANALTVCQTYVELFQIDTNRANIVPTLEWLDSGRSNTPSGARVWYLDKNEKIADSLYVGAPVFALIADAVSAKNSTRDRKYLAWLDDFYWDVHGLLMDEGEGLMYRDQRYKGATNAAGNKIFWSRGNGWVFAGLPRILDHLRAGHPTHPKYVALFQQMAASLIKRQGADGLWRPNLADANEFSMPESSGSGFFCYGLAWGVRNGLLDRKTYLPHVQRAWEGLVNECVSPEGRVWWGQLVGHDPVAVKKEDTHEYVTGAFLLAGSEVLRLAQNGEFSSREKRSSFRPGEVIRDSDGEPLHVSGGGFLFENGVYYFFGEDKRSGMGGAGYTHAISCYSTRDLYNWKNEGNVAPEVGLGTELFKKYPLAERAKVIRNDKTGKYVMWMHMEDAHYAAATTGIAVADKITGPDQFVKFIKVNDDRNRDCTLFKDDDGKAYYIYSGGDNNHLDIAELSDDYLSPVRVHNSEMHCEAPSIFKHDGIYYMLKSLCTGFRLNDNDYGYATEMMGKWTNGQHFAVGPNATNTFQSQVTYVLRLQHGKFAQRPTFVYVGDRWNSRQLFDSRILFLPLYVKGKGELEVQWKDEWDLSVFVM